MAVLNNMEQLFLNGAIEGFTDLVMPITSFSYASDTAGASLNDKVKVAYVANASGSSAFTYAAGYSGAGQGVTGKDITLDKLLYQPIQLTDADFAKITPEIVTRLGRQAGARLASDVLSASFAAVITEGNFPVSSSVPYTAAAFSSSVAWADLDKMANDAKWPDGERALIAGTTLWQACMQNTTFNQAYGYGGTELVRSGTIPMAFGFKPYKTTVTLPNSDKGFAVNPNAVLLGMAWHQPQGEAASVVASTRALDEKTGLVIGYRSWYDPAKATTIRVIDCLFGVALGNANALIHIK